MKSFYNNSRKWPKRKKKTYLQIENKDIATMIFKKQSISFEHRRKKKYIPTNSKKSYKTSYKQYCGTSFFMYRAFYSKTKWLLEN